jgi:hypothetical protein
MAEKQLKLLATVYNRPLSDERDAPTETIREGDLFTPKDAAETQRLVESGAAIDPAEYQKQLKADIEQRQAVLDAEKAQLDERSKTLAAEAKSSQAKG